MEKEKKKKEKKVLDKASRAFRFRKFVNSTVAKSSLGRKAILHFLGDAGSHVIDSLTSAVAVTHSKKVSKDLKEIIIQMALKGKLLHDTRNLTQKDVLPLMDPVNYLVVQLYHFIGVNSSECTTDAAGLAQNAARLRADIVELLSPHMTPKNIGKLSFFFETIATETFLTDLVTKPEVQNSREALYERLGDILAPLLATTEDENQCVYASCRKKVIGAAVKSESGCRKLSYCPNHHRKIFLRLKQTPTVRHFMVEDPTYTPFEEFMESRLPANFLPLYKGTTNFQRCSKNVRVGFAKAILNKYFNENCTNPAPDVPKELVQELEKAVEEKAVVPTSCDAMNKICSEAIEQVFHQQFVSSSEFADYLKLLELPSFLESSFVAVDIRKTQQASLMNLEIDLQDLKLSGEESKSDIDDDG
mmetsp:Transcript_16106/g.31560  ORF Transcript_16106/g.31560 Transcript_16106/m.31560 type:complete len:417 (-) Transcript_16106:108-1358(-)|eukprot:CAMPEP_0175134534 /NCGR_PEP_ID=MMETSP0087-20121206/8231_1 /TAXON_ID=136419 /ORGANISM="Unknown Unknown, Strain D1" /LENGTH=416 /DNA_ID=CAMNT_0016417105 /DNA_START=86 /DNA_END=1336 /DNA_ORIENTATION=-